MNRQQLDALVEERRLAREKAEADEKSLKEVLTEVKKLSDAIDAADGGATEKEVGSAVRTGCNLIHERLDRLDEKEGVVSKGFEELRKVLERPDGKADLRGLLGDLQSLAEAIQREAKAAADAEGKILKTLAEDQEKTATAVREQSTAMQKLAIEQEKMATALTKLADAAGDTAAKQKNDNEKLTEELAQAKAAIDRHKADLSTAATRREELVAKHGEAIGEMRALHKMQLASITKKHDEETAALKAHIQELQRQLSEQAEPSEQPPPSSSRGALSFPETLPRRPLTTPSYGDPTPFPVETPHILPPQRDTLMVTPSETPSARRRGSALEEENRKKRRALSTSAVLSSKTVEWAVSTSDDEDEDTLRPLQFSSASSSLVPFITGSGPTRAGRASGFEPAPSAPTAAMSPVPASGSFEPLTSASAAMVRYSPGSPSQRPPSRFAQRASPGSPRQRSSSGLARHRSSSGLVPQSSGSPTASPGPVSSSSRGPGRIFSMFAPAPVPSGSASDRDPLPGSRPASVMSGSSGRSLFSGGRTFSLFSSGPAGRAPAPVITDPAMDRGDFAGGMPATGLGIQIPSGGGFASASAAVSDLARSPSPPPAGTVAVRLPTTMQTPVEFLAAGRVSDGDVAQSVSAATIGRVDAKIAGWKEKAAAMRKGGEALWARPGSKMTRCVAVKWSRVTNPKWPANDYHNPADANPAFACPLCVAAFSYCIIENKIV